MFVKLLDVKGNRVYIDPYSVAFIMEHKPATTPYENGSLVSAPYTEIGLRSGESIYVKDDCSVIEEMIAKGLE